MIPFLLLIIYLWLMELSSGVLNRDPLFIRPVYHRLEPLLVAQIPFDGAADAAAEAMLRFPAKFILEPSGVNRVSAIMSRTINDVFNQRQMRPEFRLKYKLIKHFADCGNHFDVGLLARTANVV